MSITHRIRENKRSWLGWIVLLLCLVSFIRGAYQLGDQSLWWDESLSLHRATRPFSFILSNRILFLYGTQETPITPDHHPPLYFMLVRLVVLAAGNSEFSLRYLSLVSCVLIVPLVCQCGRRLFGPGSGLCAALLAAGSPLYLWAQQEARPYALATLFGVISFYALIRLLGLSTDGAATALPVRTGTWAALYILSSAAMLVTHYHSLQLLPVHVAIFLLARGRLRGRAWWALLAVGAVASVVALYGLRYIMPRSDIAGYDFIPLRILVLDMLRSFPLGVSGTRLVFYQWLAGGLLLAALAVLLIRRPVSMARRNARAGRNAVASHNAVASRNAVVSRNALYLLLGLVLPVLQIYLISLVRPIYMNIRHLIFASPFYYLLLGAGVAWAWRVRLGRWGRAASGLATGAALGLLLVGMGRSTYVYFADPRYDKEDHRAWGRYLTEHVRPDDVVIVYPGGDYELYTYYSASPAPYYGLPASGASTEQTLRQVREISRDYDRVWFAHSLTPGWAYAGNGTLPWLKENAIQVAFAEFPGHLNTFPVYAFRLDPPVVSALPEDASPLALDFSGQLHLLGVRAVARQVEAGHPLLLSLYWSVPQPLDREFRFTISIVDEQGRSWASLDHVPYRGTYPLSAWPVGGIVRDDIDIDIPLGAPPGRYWVNVSVYPADRSGPSLAVQELEGGLTVGLIVPVFEVAVARPASPPSDAELSIERPSRQHYGDLELLGHDYRGGTYRPGEAASLDLYWRAIRAPGRDRTFVLQLADSAGRIWARQQIAPAVGYPADRWQKGEFVRGKHRFRVPIEVPKGDYALWLVPEDDASFFAWPWSDRPVRLGSLSVRPTDDARSFDLPPMQNQVGVLLETKVELLGYDLESAIVQPGQVVSCTLYWRGLQEMAQNYTVFTHLVAPDGTTWGQWDNQPQGGRMPTTRWLPGQVIADPYQIPLSQDAPPGPLSLRIGMYDLQTMTRLPIHDKQGALVGDSVEIAQVKVLDGTE